MIAITGFGGHAFGSWRARFSTERPLDRPMWLRDFLPQRFPNARVMTYGYDSRLRGSNEANITDYRRGFIQCLRNSRRQCPVSAHLTTLQSNMLIISLWYIGTSRRLFRTQFGRDPSCSGRRASHKLNCRATLQAADRDLDNALIIVITANGSRL